MRFSHLILLTFCLIFYGATTLAQPVITGQVPDPILINEGQSIAVQFSHLTVNDVNYPTGYTLTIGDGTNYTHAGNTITPTTNFFGTILAPVTVNDGTQDSDPFNLEILVNNIPEITAQDALSVAEDQNITLKEQDVTISDPDNNPSDFSLVVTTGTNYTFSGLIITPSPNYNGPLIVNLQVTDGQATSAVYELDITVTSVNDLPVAVADVTSTNEDVAVMLNVTTNDTDPDGNGTINVATVDLDPATGGIQSSLTVPSVGTFVANASGVVTFTPVANYNGSASATYTVNDTGGGTSNVATISITVNSVSDLPVAANDAASTNEDVATVLNVTTNDTDPDGNGTINVATVDLEPGTGGIQNSHTVVAVGTFAVDASGVVTFTPVANYNGPASATYTVNDVGGATSNVATISITVNSVNDLPVAVNDATATTEEVPVLLNVTTNDTDPDGNGTINVATVDLDPGTAGIQSSFTVSAVGTFVVNASGVVTFTPVANFSGPASATYTINDASGATSNAATIAITVTDTNDAPDATDDAVTINEDNSGTINVVANDTDPDGTVNATTVDLNTGTIGIQGTNTTAAGSWSVNASGVVTFNPVSNFNGPATLTYTVNDNDGATSDVATISVTVTAVNDAPVANGDTGATTEETGVAINVVSNDTDVDGNATIDPATVDLNTSTVGIQTTNTTSAGSWSVAAGVVTFTPIADFSGPATLTYTVNDTNGLSSNQATISINVTSVNDLPTANDDVATTNEDVLVTVNVVANDSDIDGTINVTTVDLNTTTAGIQATNSTPAGSWSVSVAGVVTFVPAANVNGPATLDYTVNDSGGATSDPATITITVSPVNDPPLATNDAASTTEDTPVNITVLSNDTDIDGSLSPTTVDLNTSTAGIQITNTSAGGSFSVNSLGVVTFTPLANFSGPTTLTYTVNDNGGLTSNSATITVTVSGENDAPVANNDVASTNEETAAIVNVLTNDTDPDGNGTINAATVDLDPVTAGIQSSFTVAAVGTFAVNASGVVTFTPVANFNGLASVTYTVNDTGGATSNVATLSITVNSVNDLPVALDDATTTAEDVGVTLNVVSNDTDPDGTINVASVDLNTGLAGIQNSNTVAGVGTFTVNALGVVTYTPASNFNGPTTLPYRVNDNDGATSNAANITITVSASNDAPVAINDAATTNEDAAVTVNVVTNDTDIDGTINAGTVDLNTTTAGIQATATISGGTLSVNASGIVTYTPTVNFYGTASGSYTVNDNSGATSNVATITFTINAVNDPPIANNDITNSEEDEVVTINVVTNDIDIDGTISANTVDLNTTTAGIQNTITVTAGTFTVDATGVVTYTPTAGFNGNASITYNVRDELGGVSNAATITISVNSINSNPVATNDAATTNEDVVATLNLVSNDTDPDGTINAATVDLNPGVAGIQNTNTIASGTFVVNPSGVLTFTPIANFNGSASITYTVNDNVGATSNAASITITVTSVNDAPVANNDTGSGNEGVAITVTVVTNDTDVDGTIDAATVDLNTSTAGIQNTITTAAGSWSVNAGGIVSFTSVNNFSGPATLTYRVNDNGGATSGNATITITVNGVNDPPVAGNDAATTNEDVVVTVNLVANDTDEEGGLSASTVDLNTTTAGIQNTITTAAGTFSVNGSGVLSYTPTANFNGTASLTYTVSDTGGLTSNVATVTITVTSVNDLPVAGNDAATTDEDNAVIFNVSDNDTDVDGLVNASSVDLNTTLAGIQNTNTTTAGSFSVNTTGDVTFTPNVNFFGSTSLAYRINDNTGATSNSATITVTVNAVNDPPVFNPITDVIILENAGQQTITITGITPGPSESQPLLLTATSGNTALIPHPTVTYNGTGATATISFTPVASQIGTAVITVKLVDTGLSEFSRTFTVSVTEINDPPTLDAVTFGPILEDAALQNIPLTGITAGPGETQTLSVTVSSNNAALFETLDIVYTSPLTTGTLRIKPLANANGSATITVRVQDSGPNTPPPSVNFFTRTFTLTVTAVNDLPVFQSTPVETASVNEPYEYLINVTDVDGDVITLTTPSKPVWTTLTSQGNGKARLHGTPLPIHAGTTTVIVHAKDPTGAAVAQEFQLTVNARPTVSNFSMSTNEDTPKAFTQQQFTAAFSDPGGVISSIRIEKLPNVKKGTLKLNGAPVSLNQEIPFASIPQLTYDPLPDSSGIDTLRWNASDGLLYANNNALAIITTVSVNDAPVITGLESQPLEYEKGTEVASAITLTLDITDVDDDSLTSAEIRFQPQLFNPSNDGLSFTSSALVNGGYNTQSGVLLLTGKAPLAEYVQVIRSIQYNYVNLTNVDPETKVLSITLNDGKNSSLTSDRTLNLVYKFKELDIPTGFTPNGDSQNDTWKITAETGVDQYLDTNIRVYNKRGILVFETVGFDSPWDGRFNGEVLPADSYFYTIEINDLKPAKLYKGVITILR